MARQLLGRALAALALSAALLVPAAAARGKTTSTATAPGFAPGNNPLAPALPAAPQPTTSSTTPAVVNPTTTGAGDSGLSGGGAIAIALGAVLILGGISFFIWRDARRRAPVRHRTAAAEAGSGRAGAKARAKPGKLSPAERRRRKRGRAR